MPDAPNRSGLVQQLPAGSRTPHGGAAHVFYYFDSAGEALPTSEGAAACEVHELDDEGRSIWRTYASLAGIDGFAGLPGGEVAVEEAGPPGEQVSEA